MCGSQTSKPLFVYHGAKDKEMKEIKNFLPPMENINMIIEPFGGSFALIRHLHVEFPNKKFHVNDIDPTIINIYQNMCDKHVNESVITEIKNFLEEIHKVNSKPTGFDYPEALQTSVKTTCLTEAKKLYDEIKQTHTVASELFQRVYFNIAPGLFPQKHVNVNFETLKSFQQYAHVQFTCGNGVELCEKMKDNEDVFLFLDPPYLFTDNRWYGKSNFDFDQLFLFLQKISKIKAKVLFVLEDCILVRCFVEHHHLVIRGVTNVCYGRSKKKKQHLYVANY